MSAPITLDDMIDEVRRELVYRQRVYARLVAEQKMNSRQRDRRIDVMEAVLAHLRTDRGDGPLFQGGDNDR